MRDFARMLGFTHLLTGVLLLAFPSMARSMIEIRGEFAKLSDNAMRFLGVWILLVGGTLVWVSEAQKLESRLGEAVGTMWHRAA